MRLAVKKDIDFFALVRADSEVTSRDDKNTPMLLSVGIAILLVLVSWLTLSWLNLGAGRRLSEIGASLSGVKEAEVLDGGSAINDMIRIEQEYNNASRFSSGRLKELFALQPSDLEVLSVSYYDNKFTMDCFSARELCGADFARLLRESGAFSDISYTGVTASSGGYSFSLSFTCSGDTEYGNAEGGQ